MAGLLRAKYPRPVAFCWCHGIELNQKKIESKGCRDPSRQFNGICKHLQVYGEKLRRKSAMNVVLLDPACMPFKKYDTDAGMDLRCAEETIIFPGETRVIPSGVCVAVPYGHVGDISPRSSVSIDGIAIQGKIDHGYTGEVKIIATNCGEERKQFNRGDRIAQLILIPVAYESIEIVSELPESPRGEKGFGHSGVR